MTLHPLLNRPKPYPNETLVSWLWRLAQQNHLDTPSLLLRHLRDTWINPVPVLSSVNRLRDEQTLSGFSALTGYSVAEIQQHTLYRFASVLMTPESGNVALAFALSRDTWSPRFAWCPACVAENPYVRLHWHLPVVVCCESHHCWLRETCPQCNRPTTESDVISGRCERCNFWLEQAVTPTISVTDDLLHLQFTVMNWLYRQAEPLPLGLPDIPANTLLYVLLGLRYVVQRAGNGWTFHHIPSQIPTPDLDIQGHRILTVSERGCLYATAFRALQNWPHGFFVFLDAYRQRPVIQEDTGLRREFGALHSSWLMRLWKHPAFDFIQTAYNDYLVAHVPVFQIISSKRVQYYPELLERVAYLNLIQTATYLKISTTSVHRLLKDGHLDAVRFEQDDSVWISRLEVNRLQQQWEQYVTPSEAVHLLGLRVGMTRALIRESVLQQVPTSEGLKWQLTFIYRHSVEDLIQKLKKHTAIQVDVQQSGLSLAAVCIRNGSVGLGLPQVLKRICEGVLSACHPNETLLPLMALWFKPEVVADLSEAVKNEREWMNLQETEACLGVGRSVLHHLIKTGLLQPTVAFGPKKLFSRKDVLALRDRYTPTQQAAALLNIPVQYIFSLIQQGLLVPLSGPSVNGHNHYVFDRAQLMALQEKHILYHEMKTLTTDIDGLMRLLKAKRIEPLVRRPHVYLRKEVMAVLEHMQEHTQTS
jgi:TniQ